MNLRKLFSAVVLTLPFLLVSPANAASLTDDAKSTWLWSTTSILSTGSTISKTDKTNVANLAAFCKQKGITEVYLQINRDIGAVKYQYLVATLKGQLVTIGANTYPVQVQALDGSSTWITADGDLRRNAFFDWVVSYQGTANANQRFSGVHLDVEPYTNPLWSSDLNAAVLAFQNFVTASKARIDNANATGSLGLGLTFDIPFWYDGQAYDNVYGQGNLAEWMVKSVPAVAIMAYRDTLDGSYGGMWSVAQTELAYGKTYGKKVIIAAEVSSTTPTYVSFFEEGEAAMLNVFSGMSARIAGTAGIAGVNYSFAVDDYRNWKAIKP